MNPVKILPALLLLATLALTLRAQEARNVELSEFRVVYDSDHAGTAPRPEVAITLSKPATAVVMEITVLNASEKAEERNREVLATIKALQQAVATSAPLRLDRHEIQLRGGAARKSGFLSSRGENDVSYASVTLSAPLTAQSDLFALVDQMRAVVASVSPSKDTKIRDGAVFLQLDHPEQYRRELLAAVFADIAFLKENLGSGFEVLPSGLDGAINLRAASDKTLELWINYRLVIRSTLELTNPKPGKN